MKSSILSLSYVLLLVYFLFPISVSSSSVPLASLWSGLWRRIFGASEVESSGQNSDPNAAPQSSIGSSNAVQDLSFLVAQAKDLYRAGDFIRTLELLTPALEQSPDDFGANKVLGSALLALRKPDLAESYLFKAVQLSNWTDASLVANLAESLQLNGDFDLALRVLERGYLSMNQTDTTGQIPYEFGVFYERNKNFSAAADWYLVSALTQGDNADAWLRASTLMFPPASWNLKFAENVLSQSVKSNPSNVALIFDLGVVLQSSGRPDEAVLLYVEALRLDPDHSGALTNLASALHSMNRKDEARILYDRMLSSALASVTQSRAFEQAPGVAIALGNFASMLLEESSSLRKAVEVAYYASEIDRSNVNLKRIYAEALMRFEEKSAPVRSEFIRLATAGNWEDAALFMSSSAQQYRDEAWFNFAAGMVEFFRGNYETSSLYCSKAGETMKIESPLRPLSHLLFGCLALSNQYLGKALEAVRYFNAALASESLVRAESSAVAPLPSLGFSMSRSDIIFSMLMTLKNAGFHEQCLVTGLEYMNISSQSKYGASLLLAFSFVDWTTSAARVDAIGRDAASRGLLSLCENCTLSSEALKLQRSYGHVLTDVYDCLMKVSNDSSDWKPALDGTLSSLMGLVSRDSTLDGTTNDQTFVLITQYFGSEDAARTDAQIQVLRKNLQDERISEISMVNEVEYDFSVLNGSSKIKQYIAGRRLTFQDAFRVANSYYAGRNVIVANSDIVFDDSLYRIAGCDLSNRILALTKWSYGSDGSISLNLRLDSQDAWVFKSPMGLSVVEKSNFPMGAPKCDNRLARLFYEASYKVLNPALTAHAVEVDLRTRSAAAHGSGVPAVQGSTALVLFSDPADICS